VSVAAALTRAVATAAPRLSFPLASGLGRGLGSLAWALDRRHREVALANLALAFPRMTQSQRQQLALDSFRQAGRNATEMLWSPSLDEAKLAQVATFEGKQHLDGALAAGNGALLTTGHFGNWELMGVALALVGVPMNVIARRVDDEGVEEVLYRLRTRTGAQVIHKEDAVRSSLRALRDNQVVGVLIDQNTISPQASFVPFFGRLAATTKISAQLHVRTGAPIVMVFCEPHNEGYRFVFEPLEVEASAAADDDRVDRLTAAATAQIERHIRNHPEAWLWIHDRWRARPPDEKRAAGA